MSSPNEPGHPRAGEAPGTATGAAGSHEQPAGPRSGASETADVPPPWQRGQAARQGQPATPPKEGAPRRPAAPRPEPAQADAGDEPARGQTPHVGARLDRLIAGTAAPGGAAQPAGGQPTKEMPAGERADGTRPEAYPSELPDLSGPPPRPPQQRKPQQRPTEGPVRPAAGPRVQVGTRHKGPVRASMQIRRVDPWSVLKVSLLLSVSLFFVWMIAVAFLYLVLGGMGVWSKLNSNVGDLLTSAGGGAGGELVSAGTIFGGATLVGLVNIVLLSAMATIGAFIYNLTTDLVGGVEVTLADRD
ncbi:Transmembrane domain of uncharacterised function (DUF3566) [Mycolicibacterium phlei]|uniref:DUF3566 domain-containing protein n=3 Tax=Mycolicibacterium phlei TaxID=1771 RepID=UPI000777A03E|nr:DUF3566 domain-containing protein [Mycolicibacterium phlei]VEG06989.1 Transmembrane domain of uncharacterised function (DUF3566) [Mycobacteroides chelonae]AMO58857.1 hypothetical protein MPHLCCUG_00008 [Mycolicibacterium phlei]KXW65255.1 hypothetical protein MPHL43239_11630 [Mycolicibacterium phlei DSM 43239 = CCUG 21000]KXW72475.1 hypothetical protein MPHL43072_01470 [Mycolicibacterium phlei DSM 43072]STZ14980.1 Transmembrane domain of uncharacterised function (DUF3566) [Mycolicibacterium 